MEDQPQGAAGGPYTVERLIKFAQAGDTDGFCECFSLSAKGTGEDIQKKAQELAEFLREQTAFWDHFTWTKNIGWKAEPLRMSVFPAFPFFPHCTLGKIRNMRTRHTKNPVPGGRCRYAGWFLMKQR